MESTELIPLSGDVAKITRRAEEFKDLHKSLQRSLQIYLPLTMDALMGVHQKVKQSVIADATRQMVSNFPILGNRIIFIYSYLLHLDTCDSKEKVEVSHDLCWYAEVSYVTRRLFIPRPARCRDRFVTNLCTRLFTAFGL